MQVNFSTERIVFRELRKARNAFRAVAELGLPATDAGDYSRRIVLPDVEGNTADFRGDWATTIKALGTEALFDCRILGEGIQ